MHRGYIFRFWSYSSISWLVRGGGKGGIRKLFLFVRLNSELSLFKNSLIRKQYLLRTVNVIAETFIIKISDQA